jgi:tRNA1(Val) A37 N6-methylase TrmN6
MNCATPEPRPPDAWLGGRLRLYQPDRGAHRAGTDAVLLAALLRPAPGATCCDVGAATGAVGLAVALRAPTCRMLLVERDPALADLARLNATLNGLDGRVDVVAADVLAKGGARRAAGLVPECCDLVLTNPPYFEAGRHRISPIADKAAAHTFPMGSLDGWLRTCVEILRPRGHLGLIHRADALPDCLDALRGRFGGIGVRPVQARAGEPAIRVLITAVKGSRAPFSLLTPLVLHGADGAFTPILAALNAGKAWIGMRPSQD